MKSSNRLFLVSFAASLLVFFAVGVCGAFAADVLPVDNLSFERGEVAWGTWGDYDIREEYYALVPHTGRTFLRLWLRSGWYQDFPVKQNDRFQVSAYVSTAAKDALWGDAFGEVKVEWRNKTDNDVETGESTSLKFDVAGKQDRTITNDTWVCLDLPVVKAPAGATHARVLLTIWTEGDDKGGGCALFDDVSVTRVVGP